MAKAGLLFIGSDDGAVLFSNPNNIGRWLRIGQPLRGQIVRALWPLPENPLVVFAAVDGAPLQRSDDGGQSWHQALELQASSVVGDHRAGQLVYAYGGPGQLFQSSDAGEHWQPRTVGTQFQAGQLLVAADDPQRLYLTQNSQVWVSTDAEPVWQSYGAQLDAPIISLAAVPGQPGALYALTSAGLYLYSAEAHWQLVPGAPFASALAVLAGQTSVLLLGLAAGSIARSDDGGASWATSDAAFAWSGAITTIVPSSYHIDTAFAGTASGQLASSIDRGRSWQLLKQDLPALCSIASARLA